MITHPYSEEIIKNNRDLEVVLSRGSMVQGAASGLIPVDFLMFTLDD